MALPFPGWAAVLNMSIYINTEYELLQKKLCIEQSKSRREGKRAHSRGKFNFVC